MAKKKTTKKDTVNVPKQLLAQLVSPDFMPVARDVRQRVMRINYNVLHRMADRNPVVNAIINKRCQQIRPFCRISTDQNDRGFMVTKSKADTGRSVPQKGRKQLGYEDFFMQTGFEYDAEREDDLPDYVQYLIRDVLVYDANSTEIRRNRKGEVHDFWYVDPTTIKRAKPKLTHKKTPGQQFIWRVPTKLPPDVRFVQVDKHNHIIAQYTDDSFVYDYMFKRSQLRFRGYGYSTLEQAIDVITTFLFGMTYNRDLFVRERLPKGFLAVMGDVNAGALRAIKNHWVNEMTGYGAKFKVPIVPSGKDGVGIEWKGLGQNNRDMEYMKLLHLIITLMCAVFTIDPSELGIKTDMAPSLFGKGSTKPKLEESRDTGLGALLMYTETYLNKIMHKVDKRYVLKFTGVRDGEAKRQAEARKLQLEISKTIDEFREADGDEPFNQPWSQMPLNPQAVQIFQSLQAQQQMGAPGEEAGGVPSSEADAAAEEDEDAGEFPEFSVSEEAVTEEAAKSGVREFLEIIV